MVVRLCHTDCLCCIIYTPPLRVDSVHRERHVGVPPADLDLVPLEVVQAEVARAAQLGLPGAQVDVHLQKRRNNDIL